jgi:hypothetical protein
MAHDIDQSTGKPAIAYVGDPPWHGLGEKLPENQPIERWLKAARLDWELMRLPVQYLVDGMHRTMDREYVLARSDTYEALSIVSDDYKIVQPADVLEFYRDLMVDYGYELETAGALDHGRKVWALARTGVLASADSRGQDEIAAYVLLATSCDKNACHHSRIHQHPRGLPEHAFLRHRGDQRAQASAGESAAHSLFRRRQSEERIGIDQPGLGGIPEQNPQDVGLPDGLRTCVAVL